MYKYITLKAFILFFTFLSFISCQDKLNNAEIQTTTAIAIPQDTIKPIVKKDNFYNCAKVKENMNGTASEEDKIKEKIAFLTFDDGPSTTITPKVLDILKENDINATFLLVGKNISEKTAPIMKIILENGNNIGVHSYSHNYKKLYSKRIPIKENVIKEANQTIDKIKEVLPDFKSNLAIWRYPGGHMSWRKLTETDTALKDIGLEWIDWNCLVGDAEPKYNNRPKTKEQMISYLNNTINSVENDSILVILMHDTYGKNLTAETLPDIIKILKDRNYKFGVLE